MCPLMEVGNPTTAYPHLIPLRMVLSFRQGLFLSYSAKETLVNRPHLPQVKPQPMVFLKAVTVLL